MSEKNKARAKTSKVSPVFMVLTIISMIVMMGTFEYAVMFTNPITYWWTSIVSIASFVVSGMLIERKLPGQVPENNEYIEDPELADEKYRASSLRGCMVVFAVTAIIGFAMFGFGLDGWRGAIAGAVAVGIPFGGLAYGVWVANDPAEITLEDVEK